MVALNSQSEESSQKDETFSNKELLDEDNEEELALLSRRIQRLV
ncbi:hypothetical protein A2U01_0071614, partial [Trifolium medium]|nr:hypothetical protein [Trifolium medium]